MTVLVLACTGIVAVALSVIGLMLLDARKVRDPIGRRYVVVSPQDWMNLRSVDRRLRQDAEGRYVEPAPEPAAWFRRGVL